MKLGLVSTISVALAAVVLGSGTVHAQAPTLSGTFGAISAVAGPTPDATGVATDLNGGTFAADPRGGWIDVLDQQGAVVDSFPLRYQVDGRVFDLTPAIEQDGSRLTLTPVGLPIDEQKRGELPVHFVDYAQDLSRHQYNAAVGALIGAAVGGLIGFFILPLFGEIPGALLGALIGAGIGWVSP
ncbi:DUF456 domain-containing protein [Nocardia sp. NPDC048505]|uniref:DUF456 domain-containing protein n=1 Tax=unclassified Nocardia TaxID=2637762 RepID=UPI0033DA8FB4